MNALGLHQKEKETLALLSEENVRKNLAKPWISNRQLSVGSGTVLTGHSERLTFPEPSCPPKYTKRSGIGPERALKAITKAPRAQRESSILPRAYSANAGLIPRSASQRRHRSMECPLLCNCEGPTPPRSPPKYAQRSGIGPQRALEAITKSPRAPRESPILPRASSARAGPFPRSAPKVRQA